MSLSKARNKPMEKAMKQDQAVRNPGAVIAACALVLGLTGCDQIQSLWKSKSDSTPAPAAANTVAPPAQPQPVEMAKAADTPKPAEAPPATEDTSLAAKVKSALSSEPGLKALGIDVGVSEGVVTLYGTADTRAHREKAAQVAAAIPGVKSVKNEMVIVAGS
jgi:hyperosmotically inducible periplasmic protein